MPFSSLSPDIRRILDQLNGEDLVSPQVLADELETYVDNIVDSAHTEFFDLETSHRVTRLCKRLLEALPDHPDEKQHRLTQLAISYFVLEEDAEDDNESLIGFDDDLQVAIAAIEELGLHQLLNEDSTDGENGKLK